MILKLTTGPARRQRAESELRMISEAPAELITVMPRYIGGCAERDAVCLVTEEHQPLPRAADIVEDDWLALVIALGRLHSVPVLHWPDLRTPPPPIVTAVADAGEFWAELGHSGDAKQATGLILGRAQQPEDDPAAMVLEHGDCHTENVVRDDTGAFRWIDWQEACLGNGLADLVFLWQRAEFSGANPPRKAMTTEYAASRNLHTGADLDRAIAFAELSLLFTSWPHFLAYGNPRNQERMTARLLSWSPR